MNKNIDKSKKAYNKMAHRYNESVAGKFTLPMKTELENYMEISKGDKVLDIACGNGRLLGNLSEKHKIKATGIDIAEEMIKISRKSYPNIEFKVCNGISLEFKDNSFDIITISAAFHHFPKPEEFLEEVYRVLKPTGKIYIAEIYVGGLHPIFNLFVPYSKNGDYRLYSPKQIVKLYQKVGFSNCKIYKKFYTQIVSAEKLI